MDWQGLSARTDLTRYALSADLRRRRAATTLLTRLTSSPQAAKVLACLQPRFVTTIQRCCETIWGSTRGICLL